MKSIFSYLSLLIVIVFSSSCQKDKHDANFKLPNKREVNAIIKALVNCDSLPISQDLKKEKKISFYEDLQKLKIDHVEKNKLPKKQEGESELIEFLIGFPDIPQEKFFFSKSDSLYIEFQSKNFNAFKLSQKDFNEFAVRSAKEIRSDSKKVKYFSYYHATIPIISVDGEKAYVKYTLNCSGLCGYGYRVFLEKRKGKWNVIKFREEWVS